MKYMYVCNTSLRMIRSKVTAKILPDEFKRNSHSTIRIVKLFRVLL